MCIGFFSTESENLMSEMSWAPAWYSKQAAIIWQRVPIMVAACVRKDEEKWTPYLLSYSEIHAKVYPVAK